MDTKNTPFSEREKDVVELLLQGKGNKQIALELGISTRTVEHHLSNIYIKLGVNTRAEALLELVKNQLRDSTVSIPVESTVDNIPEPTENGSKSIFRRVNMKRSYTITGGLFIVLLFVIIVAIVILSTQRNEFAPQTQAATVSVSTPTLQVLTKIPPSPSNTEQPTKVIIPPHTVNGYTAAIENYYVDTSHIIFQVRVTGGHISFGHEHFFDRIETADIYDQYGNRLNASVVWGPAIDPTLYQFEFAPVTLIKDDHVKGEFAFDLNNAPEYGNILAQFRFDFDLPVSPDVRFNPKQTITVNNMELLLDSVTVTSTYTQVYVCFPSPSFADWNIGNQSVLEIDGQEAAPIHSRLLFDSALGGDRTAGSEPYWIPPVKNGRCTKVGFPIGSNNPISFTLTIPQLEKTDPDVLLKNQFAADYPGLTPKQAYYTYIEEHGGTYNGPWMFRVELNP